MKNPIKIKLIVVSSIVVSLAILNVLFSSVPNFSPIAAMALFGGAFLKDKKTALLVPILAIFISDIFIGFHNTMWAVYLSFICVVLLGTQLKKPGVFNVLGASLLSSVLFFVLTNFAVWIQGGFYSMDFAGLMYCFEMGIPFFKNTMISDLIFSGTLFGLFALVQYKFPILKNKYISE